MDGFCVRHAHWTMDVQFSAWVCTLWKKREKSSLKYIKVTRNSRPHRWKVEITNDKSQKMDKIFNMRIIFYEVSFRVEKHQKWRKGNKKKLMVMTLLLLQIHWSLQPVWLLKILWQEQRWQYEEWTLLIYIYEFLYCFTIDGLEY